MAKQNIKEDEKKEKILTPKYTPEEIDYIGKLRIDMATARNLREDRHDEFDGMTYTQYCESNRKGANAFIEPKKNKDDTTFVSGTTRQKITVLLSLLNNFSLNYEVKAYNDQAIEVVGLGNSIEEIIDKSEELELDDEKKMLRQYMLLEQGTVFVEEFWKEHWILEKKEDVEFDGTNIKDAKWKSDYKKITDGAVRNILLPEQVFLGDTTIFEMNDQPFIFTIEQVPYEAAKAIYGNWERWKYVQKDNIRYFDTTPTTSAYNNNWCITELIKDHVEIVKYQNRFKNEYAIFCNGTLMTPVGLPLPRKWGRGIEYNIVKQTLGSRPFWAYGVSIPQLLKTKQYLLDEMLKMAILKTQKSFNPPRFNMTGSILSSRMFMPGKIINGVDGDKIKIADETLGVTKSELMMIQQLQTSMDDDSPTTVLAGKNPAGTNRQTATQVQTQKQNAEVMTALTIFSASMLEKKCGDMRMWNILENYFEPIGQKVEDVKSIDEIRQTLVNKYRVTNISKFIEGEGPGQSITKVAENNIPNPMDVYNEEENIKDQTGVPTRIKYVNVEAVKSGRYMFYGTVSQKQKKNSDLDKVLFSEMVQAAKNFFPQSVNDDYLSERFAETWKENPTKMFKKSSEQPQVGPDGKPIDNGPAAPGAGGKPGQGARGSVFPQSMKKAGLPQKPSVNTLQK